LVFGLGLLAAAACALVIGLDEPKEEPVSDIARPAPTRRLDALIDTALSDHQANDANTESAPQQQVVNGWVARDLLHIVALQNEAQAQTLDAIAESLIQARPRPAPIDNRPAQLLVIAVVTLCWIGMWLAFGSSSAARPSSASPPASPGPPPPPLLDRSGELS
jgi:hypothetical protein